MTRPTTRPPRGIAPLLFASLLALAALSVPPAGAATAELQTTAATDPAEPLPGTTGSVSLTMENVGLATATNINVQLHSIDDGVVINKTERVELGSLGAGDKSTVTPYTFWVPPETRPGIYLAEFTLEYRYNDGGTIKFGSLTVGVEWKVRLPKALHVGPLAPDELRPGVPQELSLTLSNRGGSTLSDVQGSWTNPDGVLMPLGQGNELYLDGLAADGSVSLPVEVAAPADATAGIYALVFTFTYTDTSGVQSTSTATFAVHLRTESLLSVALDEWKDDEVTLSVSNVGLGPANAVEVRILDGPVQVRPAAAVFLGNLDPGDHTTATFSPAPTDLGRADAPLVVEVAYTDPDGVRGTMQHELVLGSAPDGGNGGLGTATWGAVAVAALAVGGVWYGVRRRRRGQKGQGGA